MNATRRVLLVGSTAAALFASLPGARALPVKKLTATTRILEVNGKAAKVFGLVSPDGTPGVTLAPGERFALTLDNQARASTIIHWHGQLPDWKQDGFPWPQTPAIAAGTNKAYDYQPIPGTFWMHSHQGMQEQQLMAAPLIVHDAASANADAQEIVMLLHDFSFSSPEELLRGLSKADGSKADGGASEGNMSGMTMGSMGQMGTMKGADLNDIDFDAYLANDRNLSDPKVFKVAAGQTVRLRVINGASSTNFWIDLGSLSGHVIAADGHDVKPVLGSIFPIAMAQRLDILLELPGAGAYPILAQVEGKTDRTGIILATAGAEVNKIGSTAQAMSPAVDLSLESRLSAVGDTARGEAHVTLPLILAGDMNPYVWSLNDRFWPDPEVLSVKPGQRVEIEMANHSMMSHPMHLHGHAFQVISLNGKPINGAIRDTVLVPAMGRVRIAFKANNPGRWALHCHNLYHMMAGMMTEVRYPGIV